MLQSLLTVGQQILTLYLLLVVGFVLGKVKLLDDRASVALSSLVMYVVSPCMMVVAFQRPLEHTAQLRCSDGCLGRTPCGVYCGGHAADPR